MPFLPTNIDRDDDSPELNCTLCYWYIIITEANICVFALVGLADDLDN